MEQEIVVDQGPWTTVLVRAAPINPPPDRLVRAKNPKSFDDFLNDYDEWKAVQQSHARFEGSATAIGQVLGGLIVPAEAEGLQ